MPRLRKRFWPIFPLLLIAAIGIIPATRYAVVGLIRWESFHELRPVSYWLVLLKDPDEKVRAEAALALGNMGTDAARVVPALAESMKDPVDDVRINASSALHKFGAAAQP